jgi:hypothetical protein
VVVTGPWVDDLYPTQVEALDQAGITVLLRVTARETLYGLERVREVGGLPFVLLRAQTMPRSRARFKRFFDLVMLVLAAPADRGRGGMTLYQLVVVGRPLLYWQPRSGPVAALPDGQVPHDGPDAEADGRARGWPNATTPGSSAGATGCARRGWTSCRSCGTSSAGRCRSSARGPNVRS